MHVSAPARKAATTASRLRLQRRRRVFLTGLYVICSRRRQAQLSKRRQGYGEHRVGDLHAYVRQEHNSRDLGRREGARIHLLPRFLEDVRSVASDRHATFFFLEWRNREPIEDAIGRGNGLPLSGRIEPWLLIDEERRSCGSMREDAAPTPPARRP